MTSLCPTCNNTIDRKHSDAVGEDVLRCRVCQRYSVEGSEMWIQLPDVARLRKLVQARDDDKRRREEFLTSDISDPRWTQIFP